MPSQFSPLEYQLYGRQMILPEVGTSGQSKLKHATVAAIGAGGLGAPALLYLAGAGVGKIIIIDDDRVETTNLHRQVIHSYPRVGNLKAESAAETLRALNPAITVETRLERLSDSNAAALLTGADMVLDGSDNFPTRYAVSRACARLGIPHIWGAILGFDAQMSVFWADHGPVYEDLYPIEPAPGSVPNCATAGVIGALAGVVGTSMALEATKLIMGVGRPLMGKVGYFSGLEGTWEYIPLQATSATSTLTGKVPADDAGKQLDKVKMNVTEENSSEIFREFQDASAIQWTWSDYDQQSEKTEILLLDVREETEHAALAVPGSLLFSLSQIKQLAAENQLARVFGARFPQKKTYIALYCAAGTRSAQAQKLLTEAGFDQVVNISGGISDWLVSQPAT